MHKFSSYHCWTSHCFALCQVHKLCVVLSNYSKSYLVLHVTLKFNGKINIQRLAIMVIRIYSHFNRTYMSHNSKIASVLTSSSHQSRNLSLNSPPRFPITKQWNIYCLNSWLLVRSAYSLCDLARRVCYLLQWTMLGSLTRFINGFV